MSRQETGTPTGAVAIDPGSALVGVVAFTSFGVIGVTIAKAIGQRIAGGSLTQVEALRDEVDALRGELERLQQRVGGEMDELHNRVDFTERVLSQQQQKSALPGGGA